MIRGLLVPIYPSVKRTDLENKSKAAPTANVLEQLALALKKLLAK